VAKLGSERPFLERTVASGVVSYLYAVCAFARDAAPFFVLPGLGVIGTW
jgi:hypothetical protein